MRLVAREGGGGGARGGGMEIPTPQEHLPNLQVHVTLGHVGHIWDLFNLVQHEVVQFYFWQGAPVANARQARGSLPRRERRRAGENNMAADDVPV